MTVAEAITGLPPAKESPATSLQTGPLPQGQLERIPLSYPNIIFYDEETYGRSLDQRRLSILDADWHPQKAGVIMVSRRHKSPKHPHGCLAVIDGHHRVVTAIKKGMADLPALVWDGLSIQQEASLYAAFGSVLRQSPMQVFRARLVAGDGRALSVQQVINDAGFVLGFGSIKKAPERLANVAMLERFYQRYGPQHLYNTLRMVDDLFPSEKRRTRDYVIHAVALLLKYYPDFDRERLLSHVNEEGFLSISSQGNGIAHTHNLALYHGFGESIIATYNKYGGHKMPRWAERVPLKDYTDAGRDAIRESVRANNAKRRRTTTRPSTKPQRHAAGTAGRRVIWNPLVEDVASRPD